MGWPRKRQTCRREMHFFLLIVADTCHMPLATHLLKMKGEKLKQKKRRKIQMAKMGKWSSSSSEAINILCFPLVLSETHTYTYIYWLVGWDKGKRGARAICAAGKINLPNNYWKIEFTWFAERKCLSIMKTYLCMHIFVWRKKTSQLISLFVRIYMYNTYKYVNGHVIINSKLSILTAAQKTHKCQRQTHIQTHTHT